MEMLITPEIVRQFYCHRKNIMFALIIQHHGKIPLEIYQSTIKITFIFQDKYIYLRAHTLIYRF